MNAFECLNRCPPTKLDGFLYFIFFLSLSICIIFLVYTQRFCIRLQRGLLFHRRVSFARIAASLFHLVVIFFFRFLTLTCFDEERKKRPPNCNQSICYLISVYFFFFQNRFGDFFLFRFQCDRSEKTWNGI